MRLTTTLFALLVAAMLCSGCDTIECGSGTHQEGDQCVPNLAINCDSDLVEFRDGRCVPRAGVCGANTSFDFETMQCVAQAPGNNTTPADMGQDLPEPEDMNPGDMGSVDAGPGDTGLEDVDPSDMEDANPEQDMVTQDTTPDLPEPVTCEVPAEGTLCLSGRLLNFATGLPVDTDEALAVLLDDLFLRGAQPTRAPFGQTLAQHGRFVLQDVPVTSDEGALQQIILIAGAAQPDVESGWQRSLTGVLATPEAGAILEDQVAFVVPQALVTAWDGLLGEQIEGTLGLEQGFFLVRLLEDDTQQPISGATLRFVDPDQDNLYPKYYLSDDLTSFLDTGETGASGVVLVVGPTGVGAVTANVPGRQFAPIQGGINPGVGVTSVLFGFAQ